MDKSLNDEREQAKTAIAQFRDAQYNFDLAAINNALNSIFDPQVKLCICYPFEDIGNTQMFLDSFLVPLATAFVDIERRDGIVAAGRSMAGDLWVGCCGQYVGTFVAPFLQIPPTKGVATMRFHEFFRLIDGRVVEYHLICDIPELMAQARVWPMAPQLGKDWYSIAPSSQDGLSITNHSAEHAQQSLTLVYNMLNGLERFAQDGAEAMGLEAYWHPKFSWYGPYGIGTSRGVAGFRQRHQIPFLNALPDRTVHGDSMHHLFADGDYVGITGWPNMQATVTGDGWMGIAPAGQKITLRSLDFWRCEKGLLRENWVLVDILSVYDQLGVNVFERMRERLL